jgi:formamidopyrimidine-DNA glycosylase
MPELPDVTVYVERLAAFVQGSPLEGIRLASPFVVRTVVPPIKSAVDRKVIGVRRIGKRIILELEPDYFLVIHLMISGRLRWRKRGAKPPGKRGLAAFDFPNGTLLFTEESTKKRASLHLVQGEEQLLTFDRGGLEVLGSDFPSFHSVLLEENHTLKRSLTDPRLFSGIGNAYSDEILHRARLSPIALTEKLGEDQARRLFEAINAVIGEWTDKLREEVGQGFPEKVTAFHAEMAVHGRYRKPCPDCGTPIQRIRYAENETNYCPTCQTGGRVLADRSLSKLLKKDWPRTIEELELARTVGPGSRRKGGP